MDEEQIRSSAALPLLPPRTTKTSHSSLNLSLTSLDQQQDELNFQLQTNSATQQVKALKQIISKKVLSTKDQFKTSFTWWDRTSILLFHLIEPTLLGLLIGVSLQISELPTIIYLAIALLVLLPMLLTERIGNVKVKYRLTYLILVIAPASLLFKAWVYCQFTPTPGITLNQAEFYGIFMDQFARTFVIDMAVFVLACLLALCYYYQLSQLQARSKVSQGLLKCQTKIWFLHFLFGKSADSFFAISFAFYLLDTLIFQTAVPFIFTCIQLVMMLCWSLDYRIPQKVRDFTMRLMQVMSYLLLAAGFTLKFPVILDQWIINNARVLMICGLDMQQATLTQQWFSRVHVVVLTYAVVITEVYFVCKKVKLADEARIMQAKDLAAQQQNRQHAENQTRQGKEAQKKKDQQKQGEYLLQLWLNTREPIIMWLARIVCFIQVYLLHDYQALVFLVWLLWTTIYANQRRFVAITACFFLPLMMVTYLFYYGVNVMGLISYQTQSSERSISWYRYGFYPFKVPLLQLSFLYLNLFFVAFWSRIVHQKEESAWNRMTSKNFNWTRKVTYQLFYLFLINIDIVIQLFLLMSGLAAMDLYHVSMLFIFVWAALYPAAFQRNVIIVLFYADSFVVARYVFSLIQTQTSSESSWYTLIGLSNIGYNPNETKEYFRLKPKLDQWILVIMTFVVYRRAEILGTDQKKIDKNLEKIQRSLDRLYPFLSKLVKIQQIIFNHVVVIFTFLAYSLLIGFISDTLLNLVTLLIVLSLLCLYLHRGLKPMLASWFILQYWTAFVFLSSLLFQFLNITQFGPMHYQQLTLRQRAYIYWIGYYAYQPPIWYYFLPYVTMFFFSIILKGSFTAKLDREQLDLSQQKQEQELAAMMDTEMTGDEDDDNEIHLSSVDECRVQEAEERFYAMQYKISYVVWKCRPVWPLLDLVSRYFHFGVAIALMALSLYFQIAIIWLVYLGLYLIQIWQQIGTLQKFKLSKQSQFLQSHDGPDDSTVSQVERRSQNLKIELLKDNTSPKVRLTIQQILQSQEKNNQISSEQRRLIITDEEALLQETLYKERCKQVILESRATFCRLQIILTIIMLCLMYLSLFLTTYYQDANGVKEYVINDFAKQNEYVFLSFWGGFYRAYGYVNANPYKAGASSSMSQFYPIFVFLVLLILERLCIMWQTDRYQTDQSVIELFQQIETTHRDYKKKQMPSKNESKHKTLTFSNDEHDTLEISSAPHIIVDDNQQIAQNLTQSSCGTELKKAQEQQNAQRQTDTALLTKLLEQKRDLMVLGAMQSLITELIMMLVWFSCAWKQNILSFLLLGLLVLHAYRDRVNLGNALVKQVIVLVILFQYISAVLSLSSYSSPVPLPAQLTQQNDALLEPVYPNSLENYFAIPVYFNITAAVSSQQAVPTVDTQTYAFCGVNITNKRLHGIWIDFVITVLLCLYMQVCDQWFLSQPLKLKQSKKTSRLCKELEIDEQQATNKLLKNQGWTKLIYACKRVCYQHFSLIVLTIILLSSILSSSLFCFGYFIFSMLLINNYRQIFSKPDAANQQLYILRFLVAYLLLELLTILALQWPLSQMANQQFVNNLGVYQVWFSTPTQLPFGYTPVTGVTEYLNVDQPISYLFLKGVCFMLVQIQILLLMSNGFKKFHAKVLLENERYAGEIGKAMAYEKNNRKCAQVVTQAEDYGKLQKMLNHVKRIIKHRDQIMNHDRKTVKTAAEPIPEEQGSDDGFEIEIEQVQSIEYEAKFVNRVDLEYRTSLKALGTAVKVYIWLRQRFVREILFWKSLDQMHDIVEQFRCGNTAVKTNVEIVLKYQVRLQVLVQMELEIESPTEMEAFKAFKAEKQQLIMPPEWVSLDLEDFTKTWPLIKLYCELCWCLVQSNTHLVCYFFMLINTISNGGLLYMVYPCAIFGVALMQEQKPGKHYWYFILCYTQCIILVEFFIQIPILSGSVQQRIQQFSLMHNLGINYIQKDTYVQSVLYSFYSEILVMVFVLIHIAALTRAGIFNVDLRDHEQFEEGLDRYVKCKLLPTEYQLLNKYQQFEAKNLIQRKLQFDLVPTRRFSMPMLQKEPGNEVDLDTEILLYGVMIEYEISKIRRAHSCVAGEELIEVLDEIKGGKQKNRMMAKVKNFSSFLWDSEWFDELFPSIAQEKPGQDLYVYLCAICIFLFVYVFFFYPRMAMQKQMSISEQLSSAQLQTPMVCTIIAIIGFMFFDRIFYTLQSMSGLREMGEKLDTKSPLISNNPSDGHLSRSQTIKQQSESKSQFDADDMQSMTWDRFSAQSGLKDQDAYLRSLSPKYHNKTAGRVIKFYYVWFLILLLLWFTFFFMQKQTTLCPTTDPYCNRVNQNSALMIFFIMASVYLCLQAIQIKTGLPELKKGGFMMGSYTSVSSTIFTAWYYTPFLFELRTIIDWTFTKTALNVFQAIKLAQVQSDMYMSKCANKLTKEKELGSAIGFVTKLLIGGGLLVFVFALIIGPMILFSAFNPISVQNPVLSGALTLNIDITNQTAAVNEQYSLPLFQTSQIIQNQNLTQTEFDSFNFSATTNGQTNYFKAQQTQVIQFSPISDTIWLISPPKLRLLQTVLQQDLNNINDPTKSLQVALTLTADYRRLQPQAQTAQIKTQFALSSKTLTDLLQMIACNNTLNSTMFPTNSTSILYILLQSGTQTVTQPNLTAGANLTYYCDPQNNVTAYWELKQILDETTWTTIKNTTLFKRGGGFEFIVFNQALLPAAFAAYSASLLIFYGTLVYLIATSFRDGFVPKSYQIFIENAIETQDIIMICQCIYIYRVQKNLENEEELYMILMDIMRSPETLKSITGTSLKKKLD